MTTIANGRESVHGHGAALRAMKSLRIPPVAKRLAILARVNAELSRGSMTDDERQDFDLARAFEMHRAELRRHPQLIAPELALVAGG